MVLNVQIFQLICNINRLQLIKRNESPSMIAFNVECGTFIKKIYNLSWDAFFLPKKINTCVFV